VRTIRLKNTVHHVSSKSKDWEIICIENRFRDFSFLNILNLLCYKKELESVFVTGDDLPSERSNILDVKKKYVYSWITWC